MSVLAVKYDDQFKFDYFTVEPDVEEVWIDKSSIGDNENEKLNYNFLAVCRSDYIAKKLQIYISNLGFFLYEHSDGVSKYIKLAKNSYERFMKKAFSADVENLDGTFYTVEAPEHLSEKPKLLVMFSSIADFPLNASIERRMFFKNFQSINKYIPKDTFILRIADIGGVLGSFYFDTVYDPEIETRICRVIEKVRISNNISRENTVLYGASKGGTAALYHGSKLSLRALAVDPIVADDYYLEKLNDAHFVEGVFLQSKAEKFSAGGGFEPKEPQLLHVITSPNSEQFTYVSNLLSKNVDINSYIFSNPLIAGHTDVAKNTINLTTALINLLLYGQTPHLKLNTVY